MPILTLTGFMGAGKTSVGHALSVQNGIPFLDLDRLIEKRAGKSIGTLFAELGEAGFRRLEAKELAKFLREGGGPLILATGGGIVESQKNRDLLAAQTIVVWLDAAYRVCLDRIRSSGRPLLGPGLRRRYRDRYSLYATAALRVRSDRGDPGNVADRILAALSHRDVSWP